MNKKEFSKALALAQSDETFEEQEYDEALNLFSGCALRDFVPVHTTIRPVAVLIRYQCQYLNGGWDLEAIDDMAHIARRNFMIV